jgi:hypothetical protein
LGAYRSTLFDVSTVQELVRFSGILHYERSLELQRGNDGLVL